jgi:hypothetical protein
MINPILKAEVDTAIVTIQVNINEIKPCLKLKKPRSLLQAIFLHHQNDVRRTFKDGL